MMDAAESAGPKKEGNTHSCWYTAIISLYTVAFSQPLFNNYPLQESSKGWDKYMAIVTNLRLFFNLWSRNDGRGFVALCSYSCDAM